MYFPDPQEHIFSEWTIVGDYAYYGLEAVSYGVPLTAATVTEAYSKGIFPWYMRGVPLPWWCPDPRAILCFEDLAVPRSLARERRRTKMTFTIDKAFDGVIRGCAAADRPEQFGTWITNEFIAVYSRLHHDGIVHSVEAWDEDGNLCGGLYGVDAGGVFCGESMFYRKPNASKLALLFLIDHLAARGSEWMDIQMMTPHMEALGAREIPRGDFLTKLHTTRQLALRLF